MARQRRIKQRHNGAGSNLPAPIPPAAKPSRQDLEDVTQVERVESLRRKRTSQPSTGMMRYEERYSFAGPLPHPHDLAQYKEIQSDYPERLMRLHERTTDMIEVQATHRQKIETKAIDGAATRSWVGLILGGAIIILALLCGTYLIAHGDQGWGFAAIIGALATFAGAYVYGVRQQSGQLSRRAREVPEDAEATPRRRQSER